MKKVSFSEIRHSVFDSFYSHLISKPEASLPYDKLLDYVMYDFECGFSKVEVFIVDLIIYILCSDFEVAQELSKIVKKRLLAQIESKDFEHLVQQVLKGDDDRTDLLSALHMTGLISLERMFSLLDN